MSTIRLEFACGHTQPHAPESDVVAICVTCGERRVRHVQAPAPRFRGLVKGPSATTTVLEPIAVPVAPGGPLLKE